MAANLADLSAIFLAEKVKALPSAPGVYLMKDAAGAVVYVGKAASLRKRVASYFAHRAGPSPRIDLMVSSLRDVEVIETVTEAEALLLECQLIKEYQPRYNVAYRDDKSYPYIKITSQERFPRIFVCRTKKKDQATYYGPYTNPRLLREAVRLIRKIFPFRSCRTLPDAPCLYYDLKLCQAPCVGKISQEDYVQVLRQIRLFIEGKRTALLDEISRRMREAAQGRRFEEAAQIRDQLEALTTMRLKPQRIRPGDQLAELQEILHLPRPPRRIEGFDISDIAGQEAVGSMVTFVDGRPHKADYRKFKIKGVEGIDDYAMLREVIRRRYGGDLAKELPQPDLILIDGGKGHVAATQGALLNLNLADQSLVGLAKEHERLFLPSRSEAIILPPSSKALHLMMRVRDEAHRFAQAYHHTLREKKMVESALDQIPGIGPKKKQLLMEQFGSVALLKEVSFETLRDVVGQATALKLMKHFRN